MLTVALFRYCNSCSRDQVFLDSRGFHTSLNQTEQIFPEPHPYSADALLGLWTQALQQLTSSAGRAGFSEGRLKPQMSSPSNYSTEAHVGPGKLSPVPLFINYSLFFSKENKLYI